MLATTDDGVAAVAEFGDVTETAKSCIQSGARKNVYASSVT